MLRLKNIKKEYKTASGTTLALKGIDLFFRKNEFVSILGPSGCGKTTTLNIIGGLDKATDGDLFIAGKSTKSFTDRDWDVYRNHEIGFVFQSYNLIPHQTVLGNVELALTIAGISKEERTKRAKEALDKVGLTVEYNKKPNQLSGGQCQRVAIARALVNNPTILLADEPTGALDTKTSVQIMDLIKEIAKERLVIMVTHNPDIASKYSTRIIKLLDGEVLEDSNPYTENEEINEVSLYTDEEKGLYKTNKAKMSFITSFKLSFKNLLSKRRRTIMAALAGSIGIIGVAMVLAFSSGVKTYVADMQNDMLSGNPVSIDKSGFDMNSMMGSMTNVQKAQLAKEYGFVNIDQMMDYLAKKFGSTSVMFNNVINQMLIDFVLQMPKEDRASINLDYGIDMSYNIYTDMLQTNGNNNLSLSAITNLYQGILEQTELKEFSSMVTSFSSPLKEFPADEKYIMTQYNQVTGRLPKNKNEAILVVDSNGSISDITLTQLGYFTQEQLENKIYKSISSDKYDSNIDPKKFSYKELMDKKYYWYPNNEVYTKTNNEIFPFDYSYTNKNIKNGLEINIVGIIELDAKVSYGSLDSGLYYHNDLTKEMIATASKSEMKEFLDSKDGSLPTIIEKGVALRGLSYKLPITFEGKAFEKVSVIGKSNGMTSMLGGQTTVYTLSLSDIGGSDMPTSILIYPDDFKAKDKILRYLDKWNSDETLVISGVEVTADQREQITYTDKIGMMAGMMDMMIEMVTIALVAFTSLSLVVSCVMIAIITYISVIERIKEIGVIRSLGGRKKDVSALFNVETLLIGLTSGIIGVSVTYLLSGFINLIVESLADIKNIAALPFSQAIIMIIISVVLTVGSGFIPSLSAAKQDPVRALRSE
ncbi:MAG: ATP-binding cassette domain-containing protein [Anaeroplasmataceae bacterium]